MDTWMPKLVSSTNWNTELSENLILNYYIDHSDTNDLLFDEFLAKSDTIINELELFFEMEPSTKGEHLASSTRLVCFIIKTKSDFTFGTLPDPHLLFYYLDPERDTKYMQKFRHEYAHWTFGRVYGEAPSLFYEGVATYAESNPVKIILFHCSHPGIWIWMKFHHLLNWPTMRHFGILRKTILSVQFS